MGANIISVLLRFGGNTPDGGFSSAAQHIEVNVFTDFFFVQQLVQIVYTTHGLTIEANNNIAHPDFIVICR